MKQPLNRRTTTVAELDAAWRASVSTVEHILYRFYNDVDAFSVDVQARMVGFHIPFVEGRIQMLKLMNAVDEQVFDAMMATASGCISGTNSVLWDRLVGAGVIVRNFSHNTVAHSDRIIDHLKLSRHIEDRTLHNIFFPPSELMRRYAEKVVAVDVLDGRGDPYRGSGFVVGDPDPLLGPSKTTPHVIVTCRHNLDGNELQGVETSSGVKLNVGRIVLSERHDLAFLLTDRIPDQPPIALGGDVEVFDEVFTLGFPKVPRAQSTLLGHRGEVNSRVERYMEKDEVLIISNLVAPGSSGGPVLDRAGRCVGMTIQWLEANYGEGYSRFSAALPRSAIVSELIAHGLYWR